jgi:flagellar protein FlaG
MEMINNVVSFPQLPDAAQAKPVAPAPVQVAAPVSGSSTGNSTGDSTQNNDTGGASTGGQGSNPPYYQLRLTIDKNPTTGGWVYKAIDRTTGKVVSELPQETAMQMQKSEAYQAGSIINAEA